MISQPAKMEITINLNIFHYLVPAPQEEQAQQEQPEPPQPPHQAMGEHINRMPEEPQMDSNGSTRPERPVCEVPPTIVNAQTDVSENEGIIHDDVLPIVIEPISEDEMDIYLIEEDSSSTAANSELWDLAVSSLDDDTSSVDSFNVYLDEELQREDDDDLHRDIRLSQELLWNNIYNFEYGQDEHIPGLQY